MSSPVHLSPSAQAVKDAVLATYADNVPRDDLLWALERSSTVAALRAVADRMTGLIPDVPSGFDQTRGYAQGVEASAAFVEGLAAELEGGNRVEASAAFVESLLEGERQ
jgi:hypothetical protein